MLGSGDEAREEEDDTDDDEGRALRDAAMEAEANGSDFGSDIADDIQVSESPAVHTIAAQHSAAVQCTAVIQSRKRAAPQCVYTQRSIITRNAVSLHAA